MSALKQFEKQQFINLETYRKNGKAVKTPVWFVQDGNALRIWTQSDSGKVKRIRRDEKVRIVPSTASGEALGQWMDTQAKVLKEAQEVQHTVSLFKKKYGVMFYMFRLLGKLRGATYTTVYVELN